jgi:4-amino-4-deoxy-L-arabinose transferase-like glycosyltransferase
VGIVWHDEGAWVHNARNKALWGTWRTDAWNPVFVAPVFTALEYASFGMLGVGTSQARIVSVAAGLLAIGALTAGLIAVSGRRSALIGATLLSTNYVFIMWNRAALMESTMTALLVCAWAAYAMGERRPVWGLVAGVAATLAWFTKAAAAFFLAAIVFDAAVQWLRHHGPPAMRASATAPSSNRLATLTLTGLLLSAGVIALVFVWPHWEDYQFYNWQMSVTRKPVYTLGAVVDRASWLPIVQGLFAQMWMILIAGIVGLLSIAARWRSAPSGERLLLLWIIAGFAELAVHDSGNERRYVMFIPALVALSAPVLTASGPVFSRALADVSPVGRLVAAPLLLFSGYMVAGTLLRPAFLAEIQAGDLRMVVRLSAGLAVAATGIVLVRWRRLMRGIGDRRLPSTVAVAGLLLALAWSGTAYVLWAAQRTDVNRDASARIGALLPPGTLVQGKLANGLSLENRIRPLFIGNGFGNFEDRLERPDARYILTYDLPRLGYESSDGSGLIEDLLRHYPSRRITATFPVDETPGPDRAVLIDKFPTTPISHAPDS